MSFPPNRLHESWSPLPRLTLYTAGWRSYFSEWAEEESKKAFPNDSHRIPTSRSALSVLEVVCWTKVKVSGKDAMLATLVNKRLLPYPPLFGSPYAMLAVMTNALSRTECTGLVQ